MGLFLRKNYLFRCWDCLSLLNWIKGLTLSLLLKLPPRKLEPWFVLWRFFLMLLCISIIVPYDLAWNTVVMSELVPLAATLLDKLQNWMWRTLGPSLAASLEPLAHRWNVANLSLLYIGITLVDVHLNWLNWFNFLILLGGLLVIPINYTTFLLPFLDVTRFLNRFLVCFNPNLGGLFRGLFWSGGGGKINPPLSKTR